MITAFALDNGVIGFGTTTPAQAMRLGSGEVRHLAEVVGKLADHDLDNKILRVPGTRGVVCALERLNAIDTMRNAVTQRMAVQPEVRS